MSKSLAAIGMAFLMPLCLCATALNVREKPRYKIILFTSNGNKIKGILLNCSPTSVSLYPGNFSSWKQQKDYDTVTMSVDNILQIHLRKRNGLLRGMAIGTGIGISPALVSSALGEGEGGAYLSIVTLPLGFLLGSVIGLVSKKKFIISGDPKKLNHLNNKLK